MHFHQLWVVDCRMYANSLGLLAHCCGGQTGHKQQKQTLRQGDAHAGSWKSGLGASQWEGLRGYRQHSNGVSGRQDSALQILIFISSSQSSPFRAQLDCFMQILLMIKAISGHTNDSFFLQKRSSPLKLLVTFSKPQNPRLLIHCPKHYYFSHIHPHAQPFEGININLLTD